MGKTISSKLTFKLKIFGRCALLSQIMQKKFGPNLQHFIFFITYEWI
jgi:hypothetical protein